MSRNVEVSRAYDLLANFGYYGFGLTPFHGVERLLPNHFLDLKRFAPVRHWPKAPLEPITPGQEGAARMVEDGRRALEGLAGTVERFVVPLSAGRDSRAILAMLRPMAERGSPSIDLFTSVGVDFAKRIDVQSAQRHAAIAGLPHEIRQRPPHVAVPQEALMRNFARIGEAKAAPILSSPGTLERPTTPSHPSPSLMIAGWPAKPGARGSGVAEHRVT